MEFTQGSSPGSPTMVRTVLMVGPSDSGRVFFVVRERMAACSDSTKSIVRGFPFIPYSASNFLLDIFNSIYRATLPCISLLLYYSLRQQKLVMQSSRATRLS